MSIITKLASPDGKELTAAQFADFGSDYIMPESIGKTEELLEEIGTSLFWMSAIATHTSQGVDSIMLRTRSLEGSLRKIGEMVIANVIENGGQLSIDGVLRKHGENV